DGHLVPNTELGHIEIRGKDAEKRAAASVRENKDWSWKKWTRRLDEYLWYLNGYFSPDLIIIGGGISEKHDKFLPLLTVEAQVVAAHLENEAGIVGAALAALYQQPAAAPTEETVQDLSQETSQDDTSSLRRQDGERAGPGIHPWRRLARRPRQGLRHAGRDVRGGGRAFRRPRLQQRDRDRRRPHADGTAGGQRPRPGAPERRRPRRAPQPPLRLPAPRPRPP